jgi:serine/threonine protein kinase
MGNKQSETTTLGHHLEQPSEKQKHRLKFLGIFSFRSTQKKKKDNEARQGLQVFQPPLNPTTGAAGDLSFFAPHDFTEIGKTYKVDWTSDGVLGKGHYAVVYRGRNVINNNEVAVKKVSKKLTRIDSLKTEVEALRAVSGHPNIVELYDVYLDNDYMYLVLELLAGGELFDRIVSSGAYSERDASIHMKKIGSALQYMHSKGIVHRDLKPENLVLLDTTPESVIKISDFGLSKILRDEEDVMMTICGTKAYSAPEVGFGFRQAGVSRNDSGYSSKVDMWSLGVIIYVIVAAYHPFDPQGADSDQVIWSRIVAGKWDFNDVAWESSSDLLKDLIRRLIEVNPEKRLSSEEFLRHPWINDATTPVRPLPSLTRVKSSRYWKVHGGAGPTNVDTIAEAANEESGSKFIEQAMPEAVAPENHDHDDHNVA